MKNGDTGTGTDTKMNVCLICHELGAVVEVPQGSNFCDKHKEKLMETLVAPVTEDCEAANHDEETDTYCECWEPKGHEGAHRCVACSNQW
jgi:hypothetical protein